MSTAILVAHVHPADPSSEDAFNRWYDDVHIPQVVERVPELSPPPDSSWRMCSCCPRRPCPRAAT